MISEIELHNFKCFSHKSIPLKPLTFLSGVNGMGKSTIIQSLLLLRQSGKDGAFNLNGDLYKFGRYEDIYSEHANDDKLQVTLTSSLQKKNSWSCQVVSEGGRAKTATTISWPEEHCFSESLFGDKFQFLSAERLGPRTSLDLVSEQNGNHFLGKKGEHLVSVLEGLENQSLPNDDMPTHKDTKSRDCYAQINAWMNEISPASTFNIESIKEADIGIYTFSYRSEIGRSNKFRPTNVGFGLSYTLPLLVALLTAPKGSLILIENPEAHLHPKAQLTLGKLIAICANAGSQFIIESHSDHVLNGIRIAVKQNSISSKDVALHFIHRPNPLDIASTDVLTPKISDEGKLDVWPEGFFDVWDDALDILV